MFKRILCFLLILTMIFTAVPFSSAEAADSTMDTLVSIVKRFPHGKYWNHVGKKNDPDSLTTTPCASHANCHWAENSCDCNSFDSAIQCMGYAHKISYEITGVMPRHNYEKITTLKASDLRVGDIIRYRWNGHSICVTGVSGNKISFTDCNFIGRCQIRWSVMDLSDIIGFTYVLRLKGNQRKNTDLDFYESFIEDEFDIDLGANHETWQMGDGTLNIRSTRKISANVIGKIPAYTTFDIYDKYYDGTYLWGKVVYGDVMGWCALNYSEFISGFIEKPTIRNTSDIYTKDEPFNLDWKEVGGASKYVVSVYDSDGKVVKKHTVNGKTTKSITLDTEGEYTAKVVAGNDLVPSWKISSKVFSFSVINSNKVVYAESVSFTAPEKLALGKSTTLKATVKPSTTTVKNVNWKSSNTSVATVDSSGKVTTKKIGVVTITCTAADGSAVKYSRKITVIPDKVKNVSQTGSTSTSVTLGWSKVKGASSYVVYKYNSQTDKYEKVATSQSNSYVMKTSSAKTYKIKVRAVAKVSSTTYNGSMSDIFTAVSGPKAPVLRAKAGTKKVTLDWDMVSGASEYVVFQIKNGEKIKLDTQDAEITNYNYTVKNLKAGTYTFAVRAVKKVGNQKGYGSYSKQVKVTVK